MVTGASTAHLAVILIDARNGIVEQSRRHAYLSSLLGIRHMVAAVNKMDLVDWDEERFREIETRVRGAGRAARRRPTRARSRSRRSRRQRRRARRARAVVRRAAAARAPRGRSTSPRDRGAGPLRLPGAVGDPARGRRARRAPLRRPDRGRDAARRATRSSCCPPARARPSTASRRSTGRSTPPSPPDSVTRAARRRPRRRPRRA